MKIKKITAGFLLVFFLGTAAAAAQNITNAQFPPATSWKKIETPHFILIFPEELEKKAADIASKIESYYYADGYSLDTQPMKWPVVINNTLFNSNGYVMGAPRHSQLYTVPTQDGFIGTADWLEGIWSHELRHIVQNDKMLRGFTLFAYWVAGEYGASGMPHFAIPRWLWEGDAVLTETLLTSAGRGRIADFERGMRTDLLNGTQYNYYKASLGYYGSYMDTVPSWYVMGYHLCAYIRKEYGIEAFNRIIEISADFSFTPLILNIAVKKVTGITIEKLYSNCLDELTGLWREQLDGRSISDIEILKAAEEDDRSSYYPLGAFPDGSIAALKTSAASINSLVRIRDGGEIEVLKKINPFSRNISFNGRIFCWAETQYDIRWGNRSWSVIRIFDTETGEYRKITDRTRYVSPSISRDGSKVAAVEINSELDTSIVIIDSDTGRLIGRYPEPAGATATQTCWSEDDKSIVYIRQSDWRKSLRVLTPSTRANRELTEPSGYNIAEPVIINDTVYFVSEETGLENIHSVPLGGGEVRLSVSRPYGTASPAASGEELIFADYSADGFSVVSVRQARGTSAEMPSAIGSGHVDFFQELKEQEPWYGEFGKGKTSSSDETKQHTPDYDIENYYPLLNVFNFHSRVLTLTNSGTGIAAGLLADDILNYSSGLIYAGYDPKKGELLGGFSGTWEGFFPILRYGGEILTPAVSPGAIVNTNLFGGILLPFDFSEGIYNHSLVLQSLFIMEKRLYPDGSAKTAVQTSAGWSFTEKQAKRDIIPPLGTKITALWYYNIVPVYYNFISVSSEFYLPGIFPNHGLTLSLDADYNFDTFENRVPENTPRGYLPEDFSQAFIVNGSIDYTIPLLYPDLALGGFMYISRVYTNCFADAALVWNSSAAIALAPDAVIPTIGMEFFTDFHLFGNITPMRAGIRFAYDVNRAILRIEDTTLLLGISLQ